MERERARERERGRERESERERGMVPKLGLSDIQHLHTFTFIAEVDRLWNWPWYSQKHVSSPEWFDDKPTTPELDRTIYRKTLYLFAGKTPWYPIQWKLVPHYHLVMTNIATERSTIFKFDKPSISMGHHFPWLCWRHNQRKKISWYQSCRVGYFCPPGSIAQLDPFTGELIYVSPMACTRLGIVWPGDSELGQVVGRWDLWWSKDAGKEGWNSTEHLRFLYFNTNKIHSQ